MNHRTWLAAFCVAASACVPAAAGAQDKYPSQPIRILVGFPPGSSTDVGTRLVAGKLAAELGQSVVVENRPGASSDIAARAAANASADGYTLFVVTIANAINSSSRNPDLVDVVKSFAPVGLVGNVPNVLVAHPSRNLKSVDDLIRAAKARPGGITFASSGNGTSPHLAGELFASKAGVQLLHVPYRGSSPAMADLLGGQVAIMFAPASTALPHIQSGKLVALAAASKDRIAALPDLKTLSELGLKDFDTSVWFGLAAPAGIPEAVGRRLSAAIQAALDTPDLRAQFRAQGIEPVKAGPEETARYIRAEVDKWAEVMQAAGVKLE
ncbi:MULTISPECIES: tripartite tricarboxylate transporter substrate binding protein [unclassified Pigmentiphaga]|uniref:tripartite tricarboxylate transporter substrate binding protein n=1 Tax=unclassified Pigmentiphaga TaxID=2626614 RepID=UPI001053E597|nr:tripartite tricarboxylate transporter substrate binding protein [Pigmentiphaga sp. D-2]